MFVNIILFALVALLALIGYEVIGFNFGLSEMLKSDVRLAISFIESTKTERTFFKSSIVVFFETQEEKEEEEEEEIVFDIPTFELPETITLHSMRGAVPYLEVFDIQ